MTKFTESDFKWLAAQLDEYAEGFQAPAEAKFIRCTADAFRQAATGKSLDEAFGVEKPDRRSKDKIEEARLELLRDAYELRYLSGEDRLSWAAIAHELNSEKLGIKWRRLCTMVDEQRERLRAYFDEELPRRRLMMSIVRGLEKSSTDRLKARQQAKKSHYERVRAKRK